MLCIFLQAFDSVIHAVITLKLKLVLEQDFIKSMYANCQFCVRIGMFLQSFNVGIGVRQNNTLSPNLIKTFINDLPSYLESTADPVHLTNIALHCLMYADDLLILSEIAKGLQEKQDKLQIFL